MSDEIKPYKKTPFGSMLNAFRYHKQQALAKLKRELLKKHNLENPTKQEAYRFEERSTSKDGATTVTVELWKRIDSETVRISTSVDVETVKAEEDSWA